MVYKYKIKVFGWSDFDIDSGTNTGNFAYREVYTGNGNYKTKESAEAGIRKKIRECEKRGWKDLSGYVVEI